MRRSLWRRHGKWVVGYVAFFALVIGLFGSARIHAYSSSERAADPNAEHNDDIAGTDAFFDWSKVHSIKVTFDQTAYQQALDAYFADGSKNWFEATFEIDGTTIERVGMRLKGNATLRGLRNTATPSAAAGAAQQPGGFGGAGGQQGGFGQSSLSTQNPESLPWLVSFDEFVDGRTFQDHKAIALRPAQQMTPTTVANEALAMLLIEAAGEPGSQVAYTTVQVNGGKTALRLALETHDEGFADEDFENNGVLYKSLASSQFSYVGDDPLAYENSFKQLTRKKQQDLAPLIGLIKWVTTASDEEFAANLDKHVDVESFARYVALQNLLLNFDDMAGPGKNYTLFYDLKTNRFQVVTWDMNLAFSGNTAQGPFDAGSFGGGGGGGFGGSGVVVGGNFAPGGQAPQGGFVTGVTGATGALPNGAIPNGAAPGGRTRGAPPGATGAVGAIPSGAIPNGAIPNGAIPSGAQGGFAPQTGATGAPGGFAPPAGATGANGAPGGVRVGGVGAGPGGGNALKEKFLASAAFKPVYEKAYRDLYEKLFAGGGATAIVDKLAKTLSTVPADVISQDLITTDLNSLRTVIDARTTALATNTVITGK